MNLLVSLCLPVNIRIYKVSCFKRTKFYMATSSNGYELKKCLHNVSLINFENKQGTTY